MRKIKKKSTQVDTQEKPKELRRILDKTEIAKALIKADGLEAQAADALGITVQTMRKRVNADEDLVKIRTHLKERQLDFAEGKLFNLINKSDFPSIKFYLESQGKERGYGKDSVAVQGNKTGVLVINQIAVNNDPAAWTQEAVKLRAEQKKLLEISQNSEVIEADIVGEVEK